MIMKENMPTVITNAQGITSVVRSILKTFDKFEQEKEHFFCIGLNASRNIKYVDLISIGTLTSCNVHPREIFRLAIKEGVHAIIVAHNHPSGNATPSISDDTITKRLKNAGEILCIEVLDHVIVSSADDNHYYSYDSASKLN